jgi:hypothetical protein
MDFEAELISHTSEHRGCGIRAASYEIRPCSWLPEACVWLQTEGGRRKIWVHSFAHCFAAEDLTFSTQLDADCWALVAAKKIIDRALEECAMAALPARRARSLSRLWRVGNGSLFAFYRFRRRRPGTD